MHEGMFTYRCVTSPLYAFPVQTHLMCWWLLIINHDSNHTFGREWHVFNFFFLITEVKKFNFVFKQVFVCMNLDIVDGHDRHKFDLNTCQAHFIYMALIYGKSYLMTPFNWSRFRTYSLITNLPSISPQWARSWRQAIHWYHIYV